MYSYNPKVGRSKSGLPTITESGGGMTNIGFAIIICGESGEKVKPLFVTRGYSNGEHAIFIAKVGMIIVEQGHDRSGERITAHKITGIGNENDPDALVLEKIADWESGDGNLPEYVILTPAFEAASGKGHCYHCRSPHYILE